jgi:two-component system response regulator
MEFRTSVLLIEGDEKEEAIAIRAIANSGVNCTVRVARNATEGCRILFESGEPLPKLVLLDLRLPEYDGFEVLTQIRNHEATKRLPVIMLCTSCEESDVIRAFDLHANSFVEKDKDLECYETRLKLLLYYWIAVNRNVNA